MTTQPNLPPTNTDSDGTTTTFPYNFKVLREEHLKATFTVIATGVVTDLEIESYTGIGDDAGGTVTFASAPADDGIVTVDSIAPLSQIEQFNGNKLPPETVERGLDAIVIQNQRQQSQIERSVRFPASDEQVPTLPARAQRADKILGFTPDGTNFAMIQGAAASQAYVNLAKAEADRAVAAATYPYTSGEQKNGAFMPGAGESLTLFTYNNTSDAAVTLPALSGLAADYNIGICRTAGSGDQTISAADGALINGASSIVHASDYLCLDFTVNEAGDEWIATDKALVGVVIGTGAGNIVALDDEAKLPAVDASQLLRVRDDAARDTAIIAYVKADFIASDPGGVYGNVISDNFVSNTLGTVTGAAYSASGDLYTNADDIEFAADNLVLNAGWSGKTQVNISNKVLNGAVISHLGVRLSSADSGAEIKLLERVSAGVFNVEVSKPISHPGGGWAYVELDSKYTVPPTGDFYIGIYSATDTQHNQVGPSRAITNGNVSGDSVSIPEGFTGIFPFGYQFVHGASVLQSAATGIAAADPSDISAYFRVEDIDTVTEETDRVVKVSIDNGATFSTCDITTLGAFGADDTIIKADGDVSGQTGSQLVWRVELENGKQTEIKQAVVIPSY